MSTKRKPERTRAEILDAAWNLISENGADVSISEIARAAGISRQAVYLHFGSRGGLLMALVRRADTRFEIKERLFACIGVPDPEERLDRLVQVWIDFVTKIYPVATDLVRLRATDRDASAAWEDRMTDLRSWLLTLTTSLKQDGALAAGWSPKEASEYLWASFSVQLWGLLVEDCGWDRDRALSVLRRTIRQTLLGR